MRVQVDKWTGRSSWIRILYLCSSPKN